MAPTDWAEVPIEPDYENEISTKVSGVKVEAEQEVQVKLADSSLLYQSVSSFEEFGLKPDLLKGVYSLGFQKPSKIQATAVPLLLSDPPKNMIGQSQAGTGKTATFALNILQRVDTSLPACQAIVIAPARELARQILDSIRDVGKYLNVTTVLAVPGAVGRREDVVGQIVVGTPGTMYDFIKKKQLDVSKVKVFVIDEADSMLDVQGLGEKSVLIRKSMPDSAQIVLFSATFPDNVIEFANKVAPNANKLSLKQDELSVDSIKQFYMDCKDEAHKAEILSDIYGLLTIGQSIIFVRQRKTADLLQKKMTDEGHKVTALHGQYEAEERDKVIDDFREGRSKVLITTNVLARGIDILQVTLVVNYDMPVDKDMRPDPETYIHRIGRTGRFGRQGVSINFVHDRTSHSEMVAIEKFLGIKIMRVPTNDLHEIESILKAALQ